jgi:hypothetical protein
MGEMLEEKEKTLLGRGKPKRAQNPYNLREEMAGLV